jgi:hypothetical protein
MQAVEKMASKSEDKPIIAYIVASTSKRMESEASNIKFIGYVTTRDGPGDGQR